MQILKFVFCLLAFVAGSLSCAGEPQAGARHYIIDTDHSIVTVQTGKAGLLQSFGHRHVIASRDIRGEIFLDAGVDGKLESSSARLQFPVNKLIVDDPVLRSQAGKAFKSRPDDKAVKGTETNMLGPHLLDGVSYPLITVAVTLLSRVGREATFNLEITVKGSRVEKVVKGEMVESDGRLSVTSEFSLTHAELGLKPFRAAGGAIKVGEKLDVAVALIAIEKQF